ncbi:MAG TPA: hypothetical protein DCO71_01915 [Gammaproteobacteria bacterium]|nr:hypothetical protein [Gammaproteobacteria bacterium]
MEELEHIPDWSLVQQYMHSSPAIFFYWVAEPDWPVEFVSENINQFGYSVEEFVLGRKKFSEIVHPQDLDRVIQEVEEYTARKLKSFTQQYRVLTCDGEVCWIDDHTVIQFNAAGEVTHYLGIITDITERKYADTALRLSQEKYRALVESTDDFIWEVDRNGVYTYCSPQVESLLGYLPGEMQGKTPFEFMTAADAAMVAGKFMAIAGRQQAFSALENTNLHRDGREIVLETSGVPFFDAEGELAGYRGIDRDITERKRTQHRLAAQREFLQSVIDGVHDAIMVINEDCSIELMNQVARDAMQPEFVADIDNPKCYEVSHHCEDPCDGKDHPCPLTKVIESGEAVTVVHRHFLADGSTAFVELVTSPLRNEDGEIRSVIEVARDVTGHVTARRELEEQKLTLQKLAHHDALTGLPNRLLFLDRLQQAVRKARRANRLLAVLFIDLDRFKQINDSLGHAMGDAVLKVISRRLEDCLREDDVVARLGGDEFTIIMDSLHNARHATTLAQKIIRAVQRPVRHKEQELYVSASVGISLYPQDGEDAAVLLRNADAAMYKAKGEGKNSFQFYTADMTELAFERVLMESHLHRALESDQFVVLYQPQIDLRTDRLVGLEALVRWQHPELGQVLPAKFITLAEDTGLILPLGEWVLKTACRQMACWYQDGLFPGRVAVNLTANQLKHDSFLPAVEHILNASSCRPEWLELEITEGVVMRQHEHSFQVLQQLKRLGIELAIDDFGTGYSSLAYLKRLPVSKLKIDRSFVRDIPEDDGDNAIARAVIAMGHSLGLRVIAEGVENSGQMAFLREAGCDEVQGYLCGPPLSADQITERLRK